MVVWNSNHGVWWAKGGLRRGSKIHFEGGELADGVVRHRVVGEDDALFI